MLKVLEPAVPVACWACSVAQNESTLFCPHCSKIQPPSGADYFSVFGLEPRLNLDLAVLEREFHRLSRKLHPDRFARASVNEKQWSLADTALLNDAYRTLKDPLRRTEYLLKLQGAAIGESAAPPSPTALFQNQGKNLLEEVFDLNMQLEELRAARKTGEENPELKESLLAAKRKFERRVDAVDRELRADWAIWDAGDAAERQPAEQAMVALLDRRRYLSNLIRDVAETLGD
ncbi:Fe-S protein assembly co-chaperone HscB [Candidatus Sulfotelmatomonas gaucii]|uniref:Fe-S protein assembly co-chaperone HscB n=1 Tax=Candidatus Sulfuritelmatomonas gaucii TaxID=2043161 RepID=A0A2N9L4R9_9BACT|nr:Fe-S protein assembly co-chaperone HscB [Candidatus Sulfotelmatomonas gaucii]